jgi:threonine/homoserine/homoserine lactone efflux protein
MEAVLGLFLVSLAGLTGGFCSSAPIGAINLWVTDTTLSRREERLSAYLIGVITADVLHATLAAWGYHAYLVEGPIERWLGVLGGGILIALGCMGYLKRNEARERQVKALGAPVKTNKVQDFLLGAVMCGANPAFLMFWVFAINLIEKHVGIPVTSLGLALFLGGIAFGDGLWFLLLIRVARKGREKFKPHILAHVRGAIAMVFVVIGSIAIYKSFV